MVATVLKLRYRVLGNTLSRSVWQLIGFIAGALWAASVLGMLVIGLVALSIFQGLEVARIVSVLGGALLVLGWIIAPVLVAGIDTTVDAPRLAPFPLSTRQIMLVLTATGLTGIPGIATGIAALATIVLWLRWPIAAVIALPCIALGVLTCVVATRCMATLSAGLGQGRRGREVIGTVVLALLILSGPIVTSVLSLVDRGADLGVRFAQIAAAVSWTPLGAAWAVPGDVAAGEWLTALLKLLIALATVALIWVMWRRALEASITSPPRRSAAKAHAGSLGWFGRMPSGGVGATWARSLTSWLHDPRYSRQLLIVPLLPIVFAFAGGIDGGLFLLSPLLIALMLAIVGYTDISYDGTAFTAVLAAGVRGRADRLGRTLGAAVIGIPITIVLTIVVVAVTGRWETLPALLGGALGIVLAGYGVSAVSSALIVMPVAGPGDSPFKSVPGQSFLTSLSVFAVWGVCIVVSAPALVIALISVFTGQALLGWIALAVGIVVGIAAVVVGIVVGGRTLDRTGPDLLARMKAFPR